MGEPKPLASLSSTLLARKGQAKPAMRPQGFAGFGMGINHTHHEDLGWNDMGHEDHAPAVPQPISADIVPIVPETPAVVRQQEELERELTPEPDFVAEPIPQPAPARGKAVRAAPGSKSKAAFTLRLDPERHLKLRLVCAVNHRSAQQTVLAALDAFLETQPAVADLARSAAKSKS